MYKFTSNVLFVIFFLFISLTVAAAGERRAPLVKNIEIGRLEGGDPDERDTVLSDILRTIQTKPGTRLDLPIWNDDIRRLARLSLYTVSARIVPIGPDAVKLVFDVRVRQILREIILEGVSWTEQEDLLSELPVAVGDAVRLDKPQLRHFRRVVQRHFAELGFLLCGAEVSTEEKGEGLALKISVRKGPHIINRWIEFVGRKFYSRYELLRLLTNRERTAASFLKFWEDQYFQRDALDDDLHRIRTKYLADGYLDARVVRESVRIDPASGDCRITIRIDEGPRYRIAGVAIQGNRAFTSEELEKLLKAQKGSYYDHEIVTGDIDRLKDFYYRHAYAESEVDLKRRSLKAGEVTLIFSITENLQITLDEIEIRGNTRTREKVIRRELSIYPDELYDSVEERRSRSRLYATGLFSRVRFIRKPGSAKDRRRLVIEVDEEKTTGQWAFGFAVSGSNGLSGTFSFQQRNFDPWDTPRSVKDFFLMRCFKGGGQSLSFNFSPGRRYDNFYLRWDNPHVFDSDFGLATALRVNEFRDRDYERFSTGIELDLRRRIVKDYTVGVRARLDEVFIRDVDIDAPDAAFDVEGRSIVSAMGPYFGVKKVERDRNRLNYGGYQMAVGYEFAGNALGGDVDFSRATMGAQTFTCLYRRGRDYKVVLSTRWRAGWIEANGSSDFVPIFERFFLGGHSSLRGFDFRRVGPKQYDEAIGGNFYTSASAEMTVPFLYEAAGNIMRLAFFTDAGNIAEDLNAFETNEWRLSAGVGLRLRFGAHPLLAPVISFDYAVPIFKERGDDRRSFSFVLLSQYF
ncbi:MAG: outer membrane protein assembly factor BamA [Planctomycetota bacterium]|nr:MAG: outer membrane protein assembly factor BamA [Planctomycetota bacterium]